MTPNAVHSRRRSLIAAIVAAAAAAGLLTGCLPEDGNPATLDGAIVAGCDSLTKGGPWVEDAAEPNGYRVMSWAGELRATGRDVHVLAQNGLGMVYGLPPTWPAMPLELRGLLDGRPAERPAAVVWLCGMNDLLEGVTPAALVTAYEGLAADLAARDVPLVPVALLPAAAGTLTPERESVRVAFNLWLRLRWPATIDCTALLAGTDGHLRPDVDFGDGLHLNVNGQQTLAVCIDAALETRDL